MGIQQILDSTQTKTGASVGFRTAAEKALIAASTLKAWFDARGRRGSDTPRGSTSELSTSYRITEVRSRKLLGATQPKLTTASETQGVYVSIVTSSTVTITIASPGVVSWTAHGLSNGDTVVLETTGALPTGLTAGASYYVVNKTTDTFQLAATAGGLAINTTGSQSGTHYATKSTAVRNEIRVGINSTGSAVSGFNNKLLTGNSYFVVPSGDWQIEIYMRTLAPASTTVIIGTSDTSTPMAVTITSSYIIRWYSAYSTTFIATAANDWPNDGAYHKLVLRYDSVAKQGEISVDGSVKKAMSALNLSGKVGNTLNLGTITSGGSTTTAGAGWAFQSLLLIGDIASTVRSLFDTVLGERAS